MNNNELNQQWVDRIYYAAIAMNNEAIAEVVSEISKHGHAQQNEWQQSNNVIYILYVADYEGGSVVRAFTNQQKALDLAALCNAYQPSVPNYVDYAPAVYDSSDNWVPKYEAAIQAWQDNHPIGPNEDYYCDSRTCEYIVLTVDVED